LQHGIELVVAIGKDGRDIASCRAPDHVYGYAVGIDLTRRDLQLQAEDKRRPWDWGKGSNNSAPCGAIRRVSEIGHLTSGQISIAVNGQLKQGSDIDQLIWPVEVLISIISASMTLRAGDLIFIGTPSGVGPVSAGDLMCGKIAGVGSLEINIGPPGYTG
jgi:fumarylpyruvate hydrolase